MSHQYHTQEKNKEKVVRISLLLCHGHQPTTKKSSLHHCERLYDDIESGRTPCQSNNPKNKSNKIS